MMIQNYRDLKVWQKSMDVVEEVYEASKSLPTNEKYGLTSQMQRSAISIPANIAEGHGRDHLGDYLRHLSIANGSLMELETHLQISQRLGYLESGVVIALLDRTSEISRMLAGLTQSLKAKYSKT